MAEARWPKAFIARMETLLGEEFTSFLQALEGPRSFGLRVNPLKITPEAFQTLVPWPLEPIPWSPWGFFYPEDVRPGLHPFHEAGLYYIQEPSAQAVGSLVQPEPGAWILDLAAAPGGKTTHLASKLPPNSLLIANEVASSRIPGLLENLERWGGRVTVVSAPLHRLAEAWEGRFDWVLLDAPCSGEGMFRKEPDAVRRWGPGTPRRSAEIQRDLIEAAAWLVRPGGHLLYTTCTFAPEENEGVVESLLKRHPEFDLEDALLHPRWAPGRPEWAGGDHRLRRTARLWPHRLLGEGHFIAHLRRKDGTIPSSSHERLPPPSPKTFQLWRAFTQEHLGAPPEGTLFERSGHLYLLPEALPPLRGIGLPAPGVYLGKAQGERFLPSRALAQLAEPMDPHPKLLLGVDDPRIPAFLRGEAVEAEGKGWTWVALETPHGSFGLSWGRIKDGVLRRSRLQR
jgi:16S rRNA C967 or C1407 C5-methylase (RsmB/RsmF family)/NOL1/NOP2/fmu family ribosome biogenesis protein